MKKTKRVKYGDNRFGSLFELIYIVSGLVIIYTVTLIVLRRGSFGDNLFGILEGALLFLLAFAGSRRFVSRELRDRDVLLNHVQWRGDEQVLDIGCGRGLLLIGAARQLTTGRATGVDDWVENTSAETMENARIEGVADRIQLAKGDVWNLPFDENSFDLVLTRIMSSNAATGREDYRNIVQQMLRVLKPSGFFGLIAPNDGLLQYILDALTEFGASNVDLLGGRTRTPPIIVARKPCGAS